MLTQEDNERLTQVGPGTPMGNLLRRYWHPIAAVKELEERPAKPIRLLGEDLALYKGEAGAYGLLDLRCGHRQSFLSEGMVEDDKLRCYRHGWLYDATGQCIDQPLEEHPFASEIKIKAYAVEAKAGLIWAYLGPQPPPLIPDWEPFSWRDGLVQIVFTQLPCNWFQCQENAIDPADLEQFQDGIRDPAPGQDIELPPAPPPLPDVDMDFDEFEYGFIYRRAPRDETPGDGWTVGRTAVWPNGLFSGDARSCRFEWAVPIDDTHTLSVAWFIDRVAPGAGLPAEERYHHWYAPITDETTGRWLTSHLLNRKFVIWLNQGAIVDRTKEHLTDSDKGLVMMRGKVFSQLDLVADGGEPKATFRDARTNRRLPLPLTGQPLDAAAAAPASEGSPASPPPQIFPYIAGQPPEIEALYKQVIATWPPTSDKPSK